MPFAVDHAALDARVGFEGFVGKNATFVVVAGESKNMMGNFFRRQAVIDRAGRAKRLKVGVHRAIGGIGRFEMTSDGDRLHASVIRQEGSVLTDLRMAPHAFGGGHGGIGHVAQKWMTKVEIISLHVDHSARRKSCYGVVGKPSLQEFEFADEDRTSRDREPIDDAAFVGRQLRETKTESLFKRRRKVVSVALMMPQKARAAMIARRFVDHLESTAFGEGVDEFEKKKRIAARAVDEVSASFFDLAIDAKVTRHDARLIAAPKGTQGDGGKGLQHMAHAGIGTAHEQNQDARMFASSQQIA